MNKKELREKTIEQLRKEQVALSEKVRDSSLDMRLGKMKNLREPRLLRKQLAVVDTIIREKELSKLSEKRHVSKNETDRTSKK